MDKLMIRQAEAKDIDQIVEIEQLCFVSPWSRTALEEEILVNRQALYLVAELGGHVTGYMGLWIVLDEGHITNLAVHPKHRNKKIAETLIKEIIFLTEKQGVESYTLEVRSSNAAALSLYRKFGFKESGLRKGYYHEEGEDAVIMWRSTTQAEDC